MGVKRIAFWMLVAQAAAAGAACAETYSFSVLLAFENAIHGQWPGYGVIPDGEGNFYGSTGNGGAGACGVVYKLDPKAHQTVLHTFTGAPDGCYPNAIIRDAAGNIYGSASAGGVNNQGVVFEIAADGRESILYSFTGKDDGGQPYGGLARDAAGNLFGTTFEGGANGWGVIFKIDGSGNYTVLHAFQGWRAGDGANSGAAVILDAAGNLYGTTWAGGRANAGTIFKLDPAGNETVLFAFTGGKDGGNPLYNSVTRDAAGNLYGMTTAGGAYHNGVVYKLDPAGTFLLLYTFTGGADGGQPQTDVALDQSGNLYGSTRYGGDVSCFAPFGCGVTFKLNPAGQETVLHTFTGPGGQWPLSPLLVDAAGNLYGTAMNSGRIGLGFGLIFKLDPAGDETLIYEFPGAEGGELPLSGPALDAAGNLIGTAAWGGKVNGGVVYRLAAGGNETVLHQFAGPSDGSFPVTVLPVHGSLYGTTEAGGVSNDGTIYRIDEAAGETVLYSFDGTHGRHPQAGVTVDAQGNLYGTTTYGGAADQGVVYRFDVKGNYTVLHEFTGGSDGGVPFAGVALDGQGNLYGTTVGGGTSGAGVVYKIDARNNLTVLYAFTGGADGGSPWGGVTLDSAGNMYGSASGGAHGAGVVFELNPAGKETVLYTFTNGLDGGYPEAGVVLDAAGNIYGTTYNGGVADAGVVYMVSPTGAETVVYSFQDKLDGGFITSGVVLDAAGNLYGTASHGGQWSNGTVFKLSPLP